MAVPDAVYATIHSALLAHANGDKRPALQWLELQRFDALSKREMQVACLAARGLRNAEIAAELGIAYGTVRSHCASIYLKLNLHNRAQLARWMVERALIEPRDIF